MWSFMNHDQTQTPWRSRSSLFRALRARNGQARDLQPAHSSQKAYCETRDPGNPTASGTITRHGLLGELMVAGTAAEIGIAGTAAAAISRKRHKRGRADGIAFPARPFQRVTLALNGPILIWICRMAAANC